ncbi:MAG TPA: glycosyltransferase family 2 protein [Solirubrobacteraceae bacterium]|nr:glycosyltransferase family 2 protein [Solirubrobacteraceae bacterium]
MPAPAGEHAITVGRLAVAITAAAWCGLVGLTVAGEFTDRHAKPPNPLEALLFIVFVSLLAGSALAYMTARLGFYYRVRRHRRVARATLDEFFATRRPDVTVLIPSYQEDARVICNTLLSAALQEYPNLRVVLLIDDPPEPPYAPARAMLAAARSLPGEVAARLAEPGDRFRAALSYYESGEPSEGADRVASADELDRLAGEYEFAERWLQQTAVELAPVDHADRFVADHVLGRLAADLGGTGTALRSAAADPGARIERARVLGLYRRLVWTFTAELGSFERKRFVSLSHEPNKAMNLNSYIGLMGGRYCERLTPEGRVLQPVEDGADVQIPGSDYILTLDADSVVLPEYCIRLVYELEQVRHADVGVCQTPYSSFPGAATRLERIAGATTDLQHIIHQGMTFHGASFWVGANAILRKRALDDVLETEYLGDWPIRRYIRDRTVIEDSESTIDLEIHGWRLLNYPERLSYSATPPDFGALCIQRHRWANGGLLILPKLWRMIRARRGRGQRTSLGEIYLRVNYLASLFWSSLALLFVLAFRVDDRLLSPLVLVIAAPYFVTMALDLRYCGYKALDVLRIYAFNLILLPVNLSATVSSIVQGLTGAKGQFRRTPKVGNRTRPALLYLLLPYLLVLVSLYTLRRSAESHLWADAGFAGVNAALCLYAIVAFVGLGHSLIDVAGHVLSWLYKPERAGAVRATPAIAPLGGRPDWEVVLYFGTADDVGPMPAARPAEQVFDKSSAESRAARRRRRPRPLPLTMTDQEEPAHEGV